MNTKQDNGKRNSKPDKKQLMLVKDGRVFPAWRVEMDCACCEQPTLLRYRSHYGWATTCSNGCGEVLADPDRVLH